MRHVLIAIFAFSIGISLSFVFAESSRAIISSYSANDFSQFCNDNPTTCKKENFENVREGSVSCPSTSQIVDKVYVHAGDGQIVYELPHEGFSLALSNLDNTATVSLTTHQNDISWIGVVCKNQTSCEETVTCSDECRVKEVTLEGLCGPVVCPANAPVAKECPTACGQPSSEVPDGKCGYINCKATPACESTPTPAPTATPIPQATATPGPVSTRWSGLGYNATCESSDIEVTYDTKREDGTTEEKVKVTFEYQGTQKTAETNTAGRATVFYGKNGDGAVTAKADGYPSQSTHMIMPVCPQTAEAGRGGQVLGATTYAATGSAAQSVFTLAQGIGMLLLTAGSFRYVKTALKA